jgi:hypothetical protein
MKLTNFQYELIKLDWVRNRCTAIYKKFPDIQGSDVLSNIFRSVLRETIIVQLHNFNQIRDKIIIDQTIAAVDKCLEPLWKPIDEYKDGIKRYRNNYIAHIQDKTKPFKETPEHIIERYSMPTYFGEWLFRAGCVMFYCQQLEANFYKEWNKARKYYYASAPVPTKYGLLHLGTFKKELVMKLFQSIQNLKTSGYQYRDAREKTKNE